MKNADVVIIDYGVGNLFNVQRAFALVGTRSVISREREDILSAEKLVLPGVGAFEAGMRHLAEYGLIEPTLERAASGCPILGICLGMQLFMTRSEEGGLHEGLNLISGEVRRFKDPEPGGPIHKIPQIGWNSLKRQHELPLLEGLGETPHMYFIHSYAVYPKDPAAWLATTEYGRDRFCSVLAKRNIFGCQFHPERSGEQGLRILKNFVSLSSRATPSEQSELRGSRGVKKYVS